jgi:hypothetical protein
VRDCQTQLISLFQSTATQSEDSPAVSLSQLQLPESGAAVEPSPSLDTTSIVPVLNTQQQPGQVAPFGNFDSFQASEIADYIRIPAQYPEHEQRVAKHEASPPVEGGGNTPDSGYDSTWNHAPLPPQETYMQTQGNFTQPLPFVHAAHIPRQQPQPAYTSGTMYVESDYVDLGGYYGLFQSRNAGFDAGMMDPSWTYLDSTGGDGSGGIGHGQGRAHGAAM